MQELLRNKEDRTDCSDWRMGWPSMYNDQQPAWALLAVFIHPSLNSLHTHTLFLLNSPQFDLSLPLLILWNTLQLISRIPTML